MKHEQARTKTDSASLPPLQKNKISEDAGKHPDGTIAVITDFSNSDTCLAHPLVTVTCRKCWGIGTAGRLVVGNKRNETKKVCRDDSSPLRIMCTESITNVPTYGFFQDETPRHHQTKLRRQCWLHSEEHRFNQLAAQFSSYSLVVAADTIAFLIQLCTVGGNWRLVYDVALVLPICAVSALRTADWVLSVGGERRRNDSICDSIAIM